MANGHYERVKRTLVRRGVILDEYVDRMSLPDGQEEDWDFIDHMGAAAIVAVRDDGKIMMVRQYRNTLERETLEIPAGGRTSASEPTIDAAVRELKEETGYTCQKIRLLISIRPTCAYSNEKIDIYLAQDLIPGEQHLDHDEFLEAEAFEVDTLIDMIYNGKIEDAKTVAGIMTYVNQCLKR